MSGKKFFALTLVFTLLFSLTTGLAGASSHGVATYTDGGQILYAGQDNPVGTVVVTNDDEFIYVEFILDADAIADGWVITETHVHVGKARENFPLNRGGNPQIGLFTYSGTELEYEIPNIWEGEVLIAAHAVVEKPEVTATDSGYIVSDTNTLVLDGDAWLPSVLTWVHPSWPAIPGAYWIWEGEYALNPRTGDVLQFKREFSIPGTPTSGSLVITTDNEYATTLNAGAVGGDNNWATVETYNVLNLLTSGPNTLIIDAENWPWDTDSSTVNPGGVIYKLSYDYEYVVEEHQKETAWAAGTRFVDQGNWATYFRYKIKSWVVVESFNITLTSQNGTTSQESLTTGEQYKFVVSGTWNNRSGEWVDAQYVTYDDWLTSQAWPNGYGPELLDVQVNEQFVDWGAYSSSHVYELLFTGNDSTVNFRVFDGDVATNEPITGWYSDNEPGALTVTIYIWE